MKALLAAGAIWFGAINGLYSMPKVIEAPGAPRAKEYVVHGEVVEV
jgi:hypothetical protein